MEPVVSFFLATGLGSFTSCSQPCSGPCLEPRHSPGSRLPRGAAADVTCQSRVAWVIDTCDHRAPYFETSQQALLGSIPS